MIAGIAVREVLLKARDGTAFQQWLDEARIPRRSRSPQQLAVLQAVFAFLQQTGNDYASRRIAAHFLLNCELGLKLAQVARNLATLPGSSWSINQRRCWA